MKGIIFVGAVLLIGLTANAMAGIPSGWSDIRGCYDTIRYNGHPVSVPSQGIRERSLINYVQPEGLMLNPDGSRPQSLDMDLVKSDDGSYSTGDVAIVLEGEGTFWSSPDGKERSWRFNGPMLYDATNPPYPFTYDAEVDVTDLGAGLLRVHNFRRIPEMPDHSMDADDTYLLQLDLKNCFLTQCTDNGDGTANCVASPYPPVK